MPKPERFYGRLPQKFTACLQRTERFEGKRKFASEFPAKHLMGVASLSDIDERSFQTLNTTPYGRQTLLGTHFLLNPSNRSCDCLERAAINFSSLRYGR